MYSSLFLLLMSISFTLQLPDSSLYIFQHLTTKTPYTYTATPTTQTPPPTGYKLSHIEFLARHGARYPTSGTIDAITQVGKDIQKSFPFMTNSSFLWLKTWKCLYCDKNFSGELVDYGGSEHYELGKRFLETYPQVFYESDQVTRIPYTSKFYDVQTTYSSRTSQSSSAFMSGLWENTGMMNDTGTKFQPVSSWSESSSLDTTLRYFDNCPSWEASVENNPGATQEAQKWKDLQYSKVRLSFSQIYSFGTSYTFNDLTNDDLDTIFQMCSYDLYLLNRADQWCTFWFDDASVDIMEYADDLETYSERSYGNSLNSKIACDLLHSILNDTNDFLYENSTTLVNFRFAHSETFVPFVTLLGLYKDNFTLTANSQPKDIRTRVFRTSNISPYACNLAIAVYTSPSQPDLVKVIVNEEEVALPGCQNNLYCSYSDFKDSLKSYSDLNFSEVCDSSSDSGDTDVELIVVILSCLASVVFGFMVALFISLLTSHLRTTTGMYTSYS